MTTTRGYWGFVCAHGDEEWGGADLCIDGVVYTYCTSENCGGACEPNGDCECYCHIPGWEF
jgi:hypothetical protein